MTYHYHDMEDYIDYHDMTIILHITSSYILYVRTYVCKSTYLYQSVQDYRIIPFNHI